MLVILVPFIIAVAGANILPPGYHTGKVIIDKSVILNQLYIYSLKTKHIYKSL